MLKLCRYSMEWKWYHSHLVPRLDSKSLEANFVVKTSMPVSLHFFQRSSVMRPLWSHNWRFNFVQLKIRCVRSFLLRLIMVEHLICTQICLYHGHCFITPSCWPRYCNVRWSTGKKPIVAPYSGDMLAIVALSASDNPAIPPSYKAYNWCVRNKNMVWKFK